MTYMIFDNDNAIDTFDELDAACNAVRAIVERDPSAVCDLAVIAYDADGMAVGEVEVAADIVPDAAREVTVSSAIYQWARITAATFVRVSWPPVTSLDAPTPSVNVAAPARVAL